MTVEDLIKRLNEIDDKTKTVFGWHSDLDVMEINMVDEMDDRVDINLKDN